MLVLAGAPPRGACCRRRRAPTPWHRCPRALFLRVLPQARARERDAAVRRHPAPVGRGARGGGRPVTRRRGGPLPDADARGGVARAACACCSRGSPAGCGGSGLCSRAGARASALARGRPRATAWRASSGCAALVRVADASFVDGPVVIGWLRPVVLLPVAAVAGLTPSQVRSDSRPRARARAPARRGGQRVPDRRRDVAVLSPGGVVAVVAHPRRARALLRRHRAGDERRSLRLRRGARRARELARRAVRRWRWRPRAARCSRAWRGCSGGRRGRRGSGRATTAALVARRSSSPRARCSISSRVSRRRCRTPRRRRRRERGGCCSIIRPDRWSIRGFTARDLVRYAYQLPRLTHRRRAGLARHRRLRADDDARSRAGGRRNAGAGAQSARRAFRSRRARVHHRRCRCWRWRSRGPTARSARICSRRRASASIRRRGWRRALHALPFGQGRAHGLLRRVGRRRVATSACAASRWTIRGVDAAALRARDRARRRQPHRPRRARSTSRSSSSGRRRR